MKIDELMDIIYDVKTIKKFINGTDPNQRGKEVFHCVSIRYMTWEFILKLIENSQVAIGPEE